MSRSNASSASLEPEERKAIVWARTAWFTADMLMTFRPSQPHHEEGCLSRASRSAKAAEPPWERAPLRRSGLRQSRLANDALRRRQPDEETRAAIEVVRPCGRKRDRAPVADHEIGRNRKSEPRARLAGRLVEGLEDSLALVGGKSRPGVADFDQRDALGADRGETHRFRPAVRRPGVNQGLRG